MTALEARLWPRITCEPGGCWLWTGSRGSEGYGQISIDKTMRHVHRVVYELLIGPVPARLQLDHLCRVRHCCRPAHLEAITRRENILRGEGFSAVNSRKSACMRGHLLTGANLYITPTGQRHCKECRRQAVRRFRSRT